MPFTGFEPSDLAEKDDLCVKPLFFHRSSITSTYDSAESIATPPPESDLDDAKFGICWLHHCTCRREKQVRTDHKFITLQVEKLSVKFISSSEEYGEPRRVVFKQKKIESRNII